MTGTERAYGGKGGIRKATDLATGLLLPANPSVRTDLFSFVQQPLNKRIDHGFVPN